jgi:uncharacterized membrane protein
VRNPAGEQRVKFLKMLLIIAFTALGVLYIAIAATTQKELTAEAATVLLMGVLLIACGYGLYRGAKWGYYLSLAVSVAGTAISLVQGLPIAVAMFLVLVASTAILMKKELRAPTAKAATAPAVAVATKSIFVNEKMFVKKKRQSL